MSVYTYLHPDDVDKLLSAIDQAGGALVVCHRLGWTLTQLHKCLRPGPVATSKLEKLRRLVTPAAITG